MSNNQVIPEAAVEAAFLRIADHLDDTETESWKDLLRQALEAAAPHMLAGGDKSELAQLIRDESNTYDGRYVMDPDHLADEIMLAGWTK